MAAWSGPSSNWSEPSHAEAAAKVLFDAGFNVSTATVDVSSRASVHALVETATELGEIYRSEGVSPSQAPPETILKVDLYGTALVLEEFGNGIARGGAGIVIASQSGHRLGRSRPNRMRYSPRPRLTNCSAFPCFS